MIHEVKLLCKEGCFNLKKFSSNPAGTLRSTPNEHRKDGVKDKDLSWSSGSTKHCLTLLVLRHYSY